MGRFDQNERNMTSFDNVTLKDYGKIKRSLKKSFKTIPCLTNRMVIETFDIVLSDSFPITYYKSKTLQIKEDSSDNLKKVTDVIQSVLNFDCITT